MPKRLELSPHASTVELEHRYRKAKDPLERSHHQIVWLLSEGRTTEEVCEVTGYSPGWVRKIARRYNERGVEGLGDRRHRNPGAKGRALLDEERQAQLREALSEPPTAAGRGDVERAEGGALDSTEERFGEGARPAGLGVPEEGRWA